MSRIHEALQRADRERKTVVVADRQEKAEPLRAVTTDFEEPPVARAEVSFEEVREYTWNPSLISLPTLEDRSTGVEQFRSLRSHVYQARFEAPLKTILIASGIPSEGKSFVAANLAICLARNSIHNILLIDGDLRRPTLDKLLGAPCSPGLSDYLEGKAELHEIMQRERSHESEKSSDGGKIPNLTFIPSGKSHENSSELVANPRMEELIATVSPSFDWIVIDAPPVLAVADAVDLARSSDAVLLVGRGGYTPYEVAQRAKATFQNSRILGFVLNAMKEGAHAGSYNYNYNYYSGDPEAKRQKD